MKLHLGCGENYLEGYVNVDYPQSEHSVMKVKPDKEADIKTLEYPEGSIEEIRSHHLFEHFTRVEAIDMLLRWRKWLANDGRLIIETPDAERMLDIWPVLNFKERMQYARHLFGSQEASWAMHLDYWGREKFRYFLQKLGYKITKIEQRPSGMKIAIPWIIRRLPASRRIFPRRFLNVGLPNIIVTAKRENIDFDEQSARRELLKLSLVGRENNEMLSVWLKNK